MPRSLALLAVLYAVVVALTLPSSPLAAEDKPPAPATPTTPPAAPKPDSGDVATPPAPGLAAPAAPPSASPAVNRSAPAGGGEQVTKPTARAAAPGSVTIKDFEFAPPTITVKQGDTVTWTNQGPTGHSATARDGSFDTGVLAKGKTASHRFTSAGTFAYYCKPHPFMKGTVKVVAASAGGSSGGGSSGGGSSSGGSSSGGSSSGGSASSASVGAGGSSGGSSTGSSDGSGTSSSSGSGGLPATGLDAGILAGLGLAFLALGALLRRRAAADH